MKARGFTLIEVMVAVFVIALGVGALLTTLINSAQTVGYLREKSFAQWIALNRLAEVRLGTRRPEPGVTRDTVEFAGSNWRWEQEISDAGISGLLRVDVRVARLGDEAASNAQPQDEEEIAPSGSAVGFIGTSVARPSGITPDWSPRAPGPGPGGDGDGDGDDDGDGDRDRDSDSGADGERDDGPGGRDNQP